MNKDFTRAAGDRTDSDGDAGVDVKWGVRPNLTLDVTINTDFAQVEADEEQVNLTRFDLFFPEKRPFFLENASTFQFGQPQSIDLFFTQAHRPVADRRADRHPRRRTAERQDRPRLERRAPQHPDRRPDHRRARRRRRTTTSACLRAQKEVGRSSYGAIFVGRYATGEHRRGVHEVEPRLRP